MPGYFYMKIKKTRKNFVELKFCFNFAAEIRNKPRPGGFPETKK